jgi:hypothetical protein
MQMFEGQADTFTVGDGEIRAFFHSIAPHLVALLPPDGVMQVVRLGPVLGLLGNL